MIYLDSPAVVKLAHAEPESTALRSWLGERAETQWISSVLTEIESFRALARYAPEAAQRLVVRREVQVRGGSGWRGGREGDDPGERDGRFASRSALHPAGRVLASSQRS